MIGGSQQQRIFRRALRDGRTLMSAAIEAGLGIGEARLIANEDAKRPPPPEAYELLYPIGEEPTSEPADAPPLPSPAPPSAEPESSMSDRHGANAPAASEELLRFIERWERLEEEKQAIAADQKDVLSEAKSRGYDTKTIREIIKLRKLTPDQRREREALLDTYKAALGMLDGTPLGKWAMERLKPKPPEKPADEPPGDDPADAPGDGTVPPPVAAEPGPTVDDARRLGSEAAGMGQPVTANPFPPYDERRAAWDEAWCAALGSDGMDIPDALKPKPKVKPAKEPVPAGDDA